MSRHLDAATVSARLDAGSQVPDKVSTQVTDRWDQVVAGEIEVPVHTDEVVVP